MGDISEHSTTPFIEYEESMDQIADSTPVEKFTCCLCGFQFSQQKYLTNHFKLCNDVKDPADRLGADTITIKEEPKTEDEMHSMELFDEHGTTEPKFDIQLEEIKLTSFGDPCPQYGQPSTIKSLKTEAPDELFTCTGYNFTAAQSIKLEKHTKLHKPEKLSADHSKCTIYENKLTKAKRFKCNLCDYAGAQSVHLSQHMITHTGEKTFKCNLCDYSGAQSVHLSQHMRTHTRKKPFKCTICDYAGAQSVHLSQHMRTHTGKKPFKCNICDYAGAQSVHLSQHMRTHTGKKPFKCTICDYAGAQSVHLSQHMRTHTGKKPFKCNICDYAGAQSVHLSQHMRRHTGKKPFKCNICDYAGAQRSSLQVHMRKHT